MVLDLYLLTISPPCRAVQLTAKALNLDLNLKTVNLQTKEHLKPEFLKLNPAHTVPTLVDDGFVVYESRAIMAYLVNKYAKGSTLYPEDPKARAIVDQRLYFDIGTMNQRLKDHFTPNSDQTKIGEALQILDKTLEGEKFVAGPNLTIADLSLVATVTTIEVAGVSLKEYKNINKWIQTVKATAPGYELNDKALEELKLFIIAMKK